MYGNLKKTYKPKHRRLKRKSLKKKWMKWIGGGTHGGADTDDELLAEYAPQDAIIAEAESKEAKTLRAEDDAENKAIHAESLAKISEEAETIANTAEKDADGAGMFPMQNSDDPKQTRKNADLAKNEANIAQKEANESKRDANLARSEIHDSQQVTAKPIGETMTADSFDTSQVTAKPIGETMTADSFAKPVSAKPIGETMTADSFDTSQVTAKPIGETMTADSFANSNASTQDTQNTNVSDTDNIFESQKANILQHTNPENNNIPVTEETLENINTNITKDAVSSNELSSVEDSNDVYNKVYDSYIKQGNGKAIATEYGLIALAQLYAKNNGKTNEEIKDDVQKYVMANNLNDSEFEQAFKTFVEEGTVTPPGTSGTKTLLKNINIPALLPPAPSTIVEPTTATEINNNEPAIASEINNNEPAIATELNNNEPATAIPQVIVEPNQDQSLATPVESTGKQYNISTANMTKMLNEYKVKLDKLQKQINSIENNGKITINVSNDGSADDSSGVAMEMVNNLLPFLALFT